MKLKSIFNLSKLKNTEFKKILHNINWLVGEKVLVLALGLVVSVFVARYLGPERLGLMNYAIAFVGLFVALNQLGLDGITVRNLVNNPQKKDELLGSTLVLRIIGSTALLLFAGVGIIIVRPGDLQLHLFVLIIASGFFFKSFETIDLWFQSQLKSKYTVRARTIALFAVSGLKLFFVLTAQPIIAFVWMSALDIFIAAIFLLIFYKRNSSLSIFKWRVNLKTMALLLKDSWPLILSGVAVAIYMKIDQVMIGNMLSDKEVGFYSVAVKLSEIWLFLPMIITGSMFPSILKAREENKVLYLEKMQKLYDSFTWFTIIVSLLVLFLSPFIINVLYGTKFMVAAEVLSIHIWSGIFVFLGVASSKYLVAENLTKIAFYRTLFGALLNIALNLWLIPVSGVVGAAIATLISYAVATMLVLFYKKSRGAGMQLLNSFNIFRIIKRVKNDKID